MEVYLKKSKENMDCAKYLYKSKNYFPSIIHSSYYSIFQLIKYILLNNLERTELSLNEEAKYNNTGIHEIYSKLIFKELRDRYPEDASGIYSSINELKQIRIESDYKEKQFTSVEYGLIINNSEELLKEIKNKFTIRNE